MAPRPLQSPGIDNIRAHMHDEKLPQGFPMPHGHGIAQPIIAFGDEQPIDELLRRHLSLFGDEVGDMEEAAVLQAAAIAVPHADSVHKRIEIWFG